MLGVRGDDMGRIRISLRGAALGLVVVNVFTVAVVARGLWVAGSASDDGEDALVALVDDVTRASQAQAAAERMLVVGRGYLLTQEPELLARAQAADAKLRATIRTIVGGAPASDPAQVVNALVVTSARYRGSLSALLSGGQQIREPREVAAALKGQLIPARDELVAVLDVFAARRREQLELRRDAARARRATVFRLTSVLAADGVGASIVLAWLVIRLARNRASGDPSGAHPRWPSTRPT